ncbi:MAG: hypothetical protein ABJH06_06605 [Paraglaciecola sp.]|uniref:hypothetical protein n=1 Tax=Paraglaciecola sp. TaxID=1920173 RepID=UPI0032979C5E
MLVTKSAAFYILLIGFVFNFAESKETIIFSSPIENNTARIVCEQKLLAAFKQMGYSFKVDLMPAARALSMSNQGITSGEVARMSGLSSEYTNLVQLKEPCYEHWVYFYVESGKEFVVNGWPSIPKEYLLGYRKGIKFIEFAAEKYGFKLYAMDTLDQSLGMLMMDRIDILVGSSTFLVALSAEIDVGQIIRLEPAVEKHELFPYIHKKYETLVPELTEKLVALNLH